MTLGCNIANTQYVCRRRITVTKHTDLTLVITMNKLHNKIVTFLIQKTKLEAGCLPQNYPAVNKLIEFQVGYKIHGSSGESLTGNNIGDFKESWCVICSNYFDDPFFIDFSEQTEGFPVYFAFHGAGHWTPIKIANNIEEFSKHLINIKDRENDKENIISYLTENFDIKNKFWEEVYNLYMTQEDSIENVDEKQDWDDWILGKLIITNIGGNKLKIVNLLKKEFNLTPQEALSLSKLKEIEFKTGYLKHLKNDIKKLNELGATTDFRPNKK